MGEHNSLNTSRTRLVIRESNHEHTASVQGRHLMVMSKLAKWQLVALVVVALLGLIYVGAKYVRLDNLLGFGQYTVKTELATSGGIFTNAEVTYRGVPVGRVGDMSLTSDGIEVDLLIDSSAPQIPASARAVVANRSAIGEQYVDLQPDTDQGPFLEDGSVIAVGDTTTPIPIENVLTSANGLVHSVPVDALHTVAKELGAAFNGKGEDLQVLADSLSGISQSGLDTLPQTLGLIRDSQTVLTTQSDQSSAIKQFSTDLDALTAQLRTSDPDIRRVIDNGIPASEQVGSLVTEAGPRAHDQPLQPLRRCSGSRTDTALAAALPALPACARRGGAHRCTGRRHSTSGLGTRDQQPALVHRRLRRDHGDPRRDEAQGPELRRHDAELPVEHCRQLPGTSGQRNGSS
ncbi:Mce family protein [Rhodococcus erythropolis]|uniref:Mce family protein n=1 Tax=Rhodococcus erythropolis TaxID=1833 RepID=A0A6G9CZJ4_RHOER|nr:Mce family protein [Rhodococcus erythropolis]